MFKLAIYTFCLIVPFITGRILQPFEYETKFSNFITTYNKNYTHNEHHYRYNIFQDNIDIIVKHNLENRSWKLDINEFADLTWNEFKSNKFGKRTSNYRPRSNVVDCKSIYQENEYYTIANEIDWVAKGAVTSVKNQGQCGSCWSFSTTGSIEGINFIKSGKLVSLSEQQLVDCSYSFGNQGCGGGVMDNAFQYVIKNGICSEESYPYKAENQTCIPCKTIVKITDFKDVIPNNETELKYAVSNQPVSVAIEADQSGFQFFSSGIFDGECGSNLDHGVLIVGYGSINGKDYWKVKNSWGTSWGLDGYILLARNIKNAEGQCGIAIEPSYPIIEDAVSIL